LEPSGLETIGPVAMTHFVGSPFWKFASWNCPKKELNLTALLSTLKPDWPPSP